jgi:sugar-specific transcriptional regulator TrmB
MKNEMPNFEQPKLEVAGSREIIEKLDSIIEPIEEIKRMVSKMQEMQAETGEELSGQFSDQNIQWINNFVKKIEEDSAENLKNLKFFVEGNFDKMKEDYESK